MKNPLGWIVQRLRQGPSRAIRTRLVLVAGGALTVALGGCSGSSGIPNLTQSAPPLAALASYSGPRMNDPRYSHTATELEDGSVLVIGGTDELHLTAFDTAEIFDQSARVDIGEPIPESIAGDFIDQDIDGNLITMGNGGRFFHSATAIDDGQVLVIGGTNSVFFGISIGPSEIYDPQTRTFGVVQIDPNDDIQIPRARHDAYRLANGRVLVSGGQEAVTVVLPPQVVGGGIPGIIQTQEARPSLETVEIFDPATLTFSEALDNTGLPAELTTSRGRAGHDTAQFGGFDNLLNTGDDVYGIVGGFMTLSAISLAAPEEFYPWNFLTTKLTSMDFYDPVTGTMNLAQGLVLTRRVNDPIAINLGQSHASTPFGDLGLTNAVYITGGDSDETCPAGNPVVGEGIADTSDLVIATFTGFGPGNGVRFTVLPQVIMANPNCPPGTGFASIYANSSERIVGCCGNMVNRSRAGAVLMDMLRTYDTQTYVVSVVVTGGGVDVTRTPTGCVQNTLGPCGDTVVGYDFFDPFYSVSRIGTVVPLDDDLDDDGVPDIFPWDWTDDGTILHPLGFTGATLAYDDDIPSETVAGYADGSPTVSLVQPRLMHTLSRIPGEDGLRGTLDDRIASIGGTGEYWPTLGDDALSLSCEIFLPPDAGIVP